MKRFWNKIRIFIINIIGVIQSLFYNRDPSIVIFDSWFGSKFADNPRFLFQYLSDNKEKFGLTEVIWITRNKKVNTSVRELGYESYMIDSPESKFYHKRALYHICNNAPVSIREYPGELLGQYSFGAKRINLWHGTGAIKRFNMAGNEYRKRAEKSPFLYKIIMGAYSKSSIYRKLAVSEGGWGECYFLTTSASEQEKFKECYPLPDKQFIISGYPRNVSIIKLLPQEQNVLSIIKKYCCSILYLPTFRSYDNTFDITKLAEHLKPILKEENIILIQKAHTVDNSNLAEYSFSENVLTLNVDFDINVLTPQITFVITDYSSILADALYHYKPILLYVPDFDEYMNGDRGFSSDARTILEAGKKFYNLESLGQYIKTIYQTPDMAKPKQYLMIRKRIWAEDKTMEQIWNDIVQTTQDRK